MEIGDYYPDPEHPLSSEYNVGQVPFHFFVLKEHNTWVV